MTKDQKRDYNSKYHATHRAERREYMRAYGIRYRAEHRASIRAKKRADDISPAGRLRHAKYRSAHKERLQASQARYNATHRDQQTASHRARKYGLSTEQYQMMLAKQGHACAICREPFTDTPRVDHDHGVGAVRGLLCNGCNVALGLMRDDSLRLQLAIDYLKRFREGIS